MGDLEIGEVDDLEMELANLDVTPQVKSKPLQLSKSFEGFPIDLQTAVVSKFDRITLFNLKRIVMFWVVGLSDSGIG